MNELLLFRLFALFPFIGIAMPDLADWYNGSRSSIPVSHVIIDVTLALCLIVCSAGILFYQNSKVKDAQLA